MTSDPVPRVTMRPRWLVSYRCPSCQATRQVTEDDPVPSCGEFHESFEDLPNGGWLRSQRFDPHPAMVLQPGRIDGNPFLARREELAAERAARDAAGQSVQGTRLDGRPAAFLPQSVLDATHLMVEDDE